MEKIVIIISLIVLFCMIRNSRKDKLEFLYNTVITPSYTIFYRAHIFFINQKDLSEKDKKKIKYLRTTATDYIVLLNNINRCKNMFSKRTNFYKQLSIIESECRKVLDKEWVTIYSKNDYVKIKKQIDILYSLYNKYNRFHYIIFDWPQL